MDFEKEFIADMTGGMLDVFKLLAAVVIFFLSGRLGHPITRRTTWKT